jgi:hypothetical protein
MGTKPKVSANGTYIFDAQDIEQLDEVSLTSIVSTIVDSNEQDAPELKSSDIAAPSAGDTTINSILKGAPSSNDQPPAHSGLPVKPESAETTDDLIAPELIFSDLPPRRR